LATEDGRITNEKVNGQKRFSVYDDANESLQTIGSEDVNLSSDGGDTLSNNAEFQVGLRFVPSDWIAFTVAFEAQTFTNVGGPNPTGIFAGDDSALSGSSPWMTPFPSQA